MGKDTRQTLEEFARRAAQRIQDKKQRKKASYHVNELDLDVTLQSLTDGELAEISEEEGLRGDMYAVYLSMVEPDLKGTAKLLKASGEITEPLEVVDIFGRGDISALAYEVVKLSGAVSGGIKAIDRKLVDSLKNGSGKTGTPS